MNAGAMFASALLVVSAVAITFLILRRTGLNFARHLPTLLELSAPLFLVGLAILPEAFPSGFAAVLHHSIVSDYVHPVRVDGTQVTETWVLARWWTPIGRFFYMTVFVGIIWAALNIFRGQDRRLNAFAICLGLLWMSLGAVARLHILPF